MNQRISPLTTRQQDPTNKNHLDTDQNGISRRRHPHNEFGSNYSRTSPAVVVQSKSSYDVDSKHREVLNHAYPVQSHPISMRLHSPFSRSRGNNMGGSLNVPQHIREQSLDHSLSNNSSAPSSTPMFRGSTHENSSNDHISDVSTYMNNSENDSINTSSLRQQPMFYSPNIDSKAKAANRHNGSVLPSLDGNDDMGRLNHQDLVKINTQESKILRSQMWGASSGGVSPSKSIVKLYEIEYDRMEKRALRAEATLAEAYQNLDKLNDLIVAADTSKQLASSTSVNALLDFFQQVRSQRASADVRGWPC